MHCTDMSYPFPSTSHPLLLKVWSLDQQHEHHLSWKFRIEGPAPGCTVTMFEKHRSSLFIF